MDREAEGFDPEDDHPQEEWTRPLFYKDKESFPHTRSSKGLETFLTGTKSEFNGTALNDARPNIPQEEAEALTQLVNLQKSCQIILKPCDKGAGIIICNYDDYVASCESHLDEKLGDNTPYYKQIGRAAVQDIKSEIKTTIKAALNKSEIEKEIYAELDPSQKIQADFTRSLRFTKNTTSQIY